MKLTPENVSNTIKACLFDKEPEDKSKAVIVEGIVARFGFDPSKLKEQESNITEMLTQLPKEFLKSGGGGFSFLQACMDKDGNQWGEHRNMDELVCLGIAIGKVRYCMPREVWTVLPGGVPYFTVDA
jgi:hypothetical protein